MKLSFHEGVLAQPDNLRSGAAALRNALAGIDVGPLRQGMIVFSGIGASWHALVPAARALRAAGRRAFAIPPAELAASAADLADAYVLVSQSGVSTETVAALERLEGVPTFAISADGASPLARGASAWLPLGGGSDTPLSTLGYTATLQALGLLCDAILGVDSAEEWGRVPELVAWLLADGDEDARALAGRFAAVRSIDAVGAGSAMASAGATALLAREGLHLPATSEETRQYLHGPLEAVADGFGCIVFGGEREQRLAAAMASYGARVAVVTDHANGAAPGVGVIRLPRASDLAAPILQIVPIQLLVHHLAEARGLALDGLRRPQDDTKMAAA
jgi:fructoselysine-6-P-deglycase FrlB-like protein